MFRCGIILDQLWHDKTYDAYYDFEITYNVNLLTETQQLKQIERIQRKKNCSKIETKM